MKININIEKRVTEFPDDLREIALMLMKELESGNKSKTKIAELIKDEVRELVLEEDL